MTPLRFAITSHQAVKGTFTPELSNMLGTPRKRPRRFPDEALGITKCRFGQNVKRATNWPDLGFARFPLRVFTKPKPPFNAPVGRIQAETRERVAVRWSLGAGDIRRPGDGRQGILSRG